MKVIKINIGIVAITIICSTFFLACSASDSVNEDTQAQNKATPNTQLSNDSKTDTHQTSTTLAAQVDPNTRYKSPVRQTSGVMFLTPGSSIYIDAEGSPGGKMDVAGLKFTRNCKVTLGEDYTVFIDKEGLVVIDTSKKKWESQKFQLEGKEMIAFFPKP